MTLVATSSLRRRWLLADPLRKSVPIFAGCAYGSELLLILAGAEDSVVVVCCQRAGVGWTDGTLISEVLQEHHLQSVVLRLALIR